MRIRSIQSQALQIPLKFKFAQSNNTATCSSSLLIELHTQGGIKGWGECCPRLYVTGESIHSVMQDLKQIEPQLLETHFESLADIRQFLNTQLPLPIGLSTTCGLELALLDAWSQSHNRPLVQVLEGDPNYVAQYSGILPQGPIQQQAKVLEQLARFQFKTLKIKVDNNLEHSLKLIRLIRANYFPAVRLQVDANCSWTYQDALRQIPVLLENGVEVFEQLFPAGQILDFQRITQKFGHLTKIMADESLTSYGTALFLLYNKVCNHFNLKLSKNGGFWNTLNLYQLIRNQGGTCQLGAHFGETSILTAAGLILASKAQEFTALEGGYGDYLLENDIVEPSLKFDQRAEIPLATTLTHAGWIPQKMPAFS
ncbi:MAG: hypothetical protein KDC44_08495 [Phaeodactylibacter sp.]|nr:hypothetical protein [Phaeodactylibacter sp.]